MVITATCGATTEKGYSLYNSNRELIDKLKASLYIRLAFFIFTNRIYNNKEIIMRYSDEGNLKFSGNIRPSSVEPTPSQGYYRDELDYGKYSITLTNSEPGLGYFGFNEDELTYDIDNHALCTKTIHAEDNIYSDGNAAFGGNIAIDGNAVFEGTIYSVGNISSEGDISAEGNGLFEGDITSYSNATVAGNITSRGCIISGNNLSVSGDISATGNITTSNGNVTSAKVSTPEIVLFDNGTCSNKIVKDANCGCIDICISGYEGNSADYNFNAHGQISGITRLETPTGTNTEIDFRTYDANGCVCYPVTVKSTVLEVAGDITSDGNITAGGGATVTSGLTVGGAINSTGNIHTSGTISSDFMELNANSINTSCARLLLNKPVCVPDIFTICTGSSIPRHYIHTISLNGNSSASTDGTINLGAAVTSATVNGITRNVDYYGSITLPDLASSITFGNVTCNVDSNGSITLPYLARCVTINGVSGCADATGKVDLGTLTAVLTVNSKGSVIISDSSTICPDRIYNSVVMGKDAAQADPTVDSCYNVLAGYNVKGNGCHNIAIGSSAQAGNATCTPKWAISIGKGAGTYKDDGIAIGDTAVSRCNDAIAIGAAAEASAGCSIVLGRIAKSTGESGIALGCGAVTRGESGIAIGCEADAECISNIAIGTCAYACCTNSIAIGHDACAEEISAIAIGNGANAYSVGLGFSIDCHTVYSGGASAHFYWNCTQPQSFIFDVLACRGYQNSPMWPAGCGCEYCGQHMVPARWIFRNGSISDAGTWMSWDGDGNIDLGGTILGNGHTICGTCMSAISGRLEIWVDWSFAGYCGCRN